MRTKDWYGIVPHFRWLLQSSSSSSLLLAAMAAAATVISHGSNGARSIPFSSRVCVPPMDSPGSIFSKRNQSKPHHKKRRQKNHTPRRCDPEGFIVLLFYLCVCGGGGCRRTGG